MSIDELSQAIRIVEQNADEADFVGPRAEAMIVAAEVALGVTLPPTYRRFLLELGAGDLAGVELYGVIDDDFVDSSVPDAVWLTLKRRSEDGLPPRYVVVGQLGDGGDYALDLAGVGAGKEAPVVFLDVHVDGAPKVLAPSFGAFMLQELQDALADEHRED